MRKRLSVGERLLRRLGTLQRHTIASTSDYDMLYYRTKFAISQSEAVSIYQVTDLIWLRYHAHLAKLRSSRSKGHYGQISKKAKLLNVYLYIFVLSSHLETKHTL